MQPGRGICHVRWCRTRPRRTDAAVSSLGLTQIRSDILVEAAAYSFIVNAYESFGREHDVLGKGDKWSERYLETSRIGRNVAFSRSPELNEKYWYKSPAMDELDQSFDVVQKVAKIVEQRDEKCHDEGLLLMVATSSKLAEMYRQPDSEHVFAALVEICQVAKESIQNHGPFTTRVLDFGRGRAAAYELRSCRSGSSTSLDTAMETYKDFIELFQEGHPFHHLESTTSFLSFQSDLGRLYGQKFLRTQQSDSKDLLTGLDYAKQAVQHSSSKPNLLADIHASESPYLHKHELHANYGALLYLEFQRTKSEMHLKDCVKQYRTAVEASKDQPSLRQPHGINSLNLAVAYTTQFRWFPQKHNQEHHSKSVFELLTVTEKALPNREPLFRVELYSALRHAYPTFLCQELDDTVQ